MDFIAMEILEKIPVKIDPQEVRKILRLERGRESQLVEGLIDQAITCSEPKAAYKLCYIDEKSEDAVMVEGLQLKSKVLRKNLDAVERLFPYVVTLGPGLEEAIDGIDDPLEKYYLDVIGNVALNAVRKYLHDQLCKKFALKKISFMSPGSLQEWPIEAQGNLFQLLTDVEVAIGVRLTPSFLMIPKKSVSGVYFQTEVSFFNCQLCQRGKCPGRKARYDEKLAREYGIKE
jgi:hypothetical protein